MPAEGPFRHGQPTRFELIETMRWEPGAGLVRGERHIDRLARSAEELGFSFDEGSVRSALDAATGGTQPLRVRLALTPEGAIEATTQPFVPLPAGTVWRLAVARTRLESTNAMLRHKTSLRSAYETARAEFPTSEAEEVLLLNERGYVCEGSFTTLFVRSGDGWVTPSIHCGLLAGVLREEMLETGAAREADIAVRDLRQAEALAVGNSLRGLIPARLIEVR